MEQIKERTSIRRNDKVVRRVKSVKVKQHTISTFAEQTIGLRSKIKRHVIQIFIYTQPWKAKLILWIGSRGPWARNADDKWDKIWTSKERAWKAYKCTELRLQVKMKTSEIIIFRFRKADKHAELDKETSHL